MTEAPGALPVLTDEELWLLDGGQGPAVLPVLDGWSAAQRERTAGTALRGLIARGLVEIPVLPPGDRVRHLPSVRVNALLADPVAHLLDLRRAAPVLVGLRRTTTAAGPVGATHVVELDYLYRGESGWLREHVGAGGLHHFDLLVAGQLADLLAARCLAPGAAPGSGRHRLPAAAAAGAVASGSLGRGGAVPRSLLDRLAAATLAVDVTVARDGRPEPDLLGVLSGPTGTFLLRSRFGTGDPVRVDGVSPTDAVADLARWVGVPLRETMGR